MAASSDLLLVGFHAESHTKRLEFIKQLVAASVNVLGFGDEMDILIDVHVMADQDPLKTLQRRTVGDDHLVLVELHFLLAPRIEYRDTGAAVIEQHIFKIV